MKTVRFFGMVLMTILLSVGFAACSSDDDEDETIPTAAELIGTTWHGTHSSWNGYSVAVTFNNLSTCTVKTYDSTGDEDQDTYSYSYDESTGTISVPYYGVTGTIKGNKMSLKSSELGSFTMTKQ